LAIDEAPDEHKMALGDEAKEVQHAGFDKADSRTLRVHGGTSYFVGAGYLGLADQHRYRAGA
jgi:hypothetical protein